jgi:23S rRNA (guanine745-N1)-methyltransferase
VLQCPLCHQSLTESQRQWGCVNKHCFDQAKEGYINLLPVQHKGSKQPGDSPEMMQARRRFLHAGHYAPMMTGLGELLTSTGKVSSLLDIGCGEGYYTGHLAQHIAGATYGMDIAKNAIKMAAKQQRNVRFIVASNKRLPFTDASLAAVTRIFAPSDAAELARVIQPGGQLIMAVPGARHLHQLKEQIYPTVREHDDSPQEFAQFELATTKRIACRLSLQGQELSDLMMMTPFAWRLKPTEKERLLEGQLDIEIAFTLHQYRRL